VTPLFKVMRGKTSLSPSRFTILSGPARITYHTAREKQDVARGNFSLDIEGGHTVKKPNHPS
jgi:hypothetical protein